MDEARRVLSRLERIEALQREQAVPQDLLAELRALLHDAEAWVKAEREVPESAREAVARSRQMLQDTSRTLLA
jgi:multidrug resistance efflux pump